MSKNTSVVKIIVERKFIGTKSVSEALIPIIYEDILKKISKRRTLDKTKDAV